MVTWTNASFLKTLVLALAAGCGTCEARGADKDLRFDPDRPLLSLHTPSRQSRVSELDEVLESSWKGESPGSPLPIVVYVHGRGREPSKSFTDRFFVKGRAIEKLERFQVRVIGFNWDSSPESRCDRPIARATSSAGSLRELILALHAHRSAHPGRWVGRPLVLITHSMGAFVARELDGSLPTVFDRIVVSAADTPVAGSGEWLAAGPWHQAFVLTNPHDRTLKRSIRCQDDDEPPATRTRLGLAAPGASLALDDTRLVLMPASVGNAHRYFTPAADANAHRRALLSWLFGAGSDPGVSRWTSPVDPRWVIVPDDSATCGRHVECDEGDDDGN